MAGFSDGYIKEVSESLIYKRLYHSHTWTISSGKQVKCI